MYITLLVSGTEPSSDVTAEFSVDLVAGVTCLVKVVNVTLEHFPLVFFRYLSLCLVPDKGTPTSRDTH